MSCTKRWVAGQIREESGVFLPSDSPKIPTTDLTPTYEKDKTNHMQITIVDILPNDAENKIYIEFQSNVGKAIGEWEGKAPKKNLTYEVEIGIEGELIWERDVIEVQSQTPFIKMDQKKIILQGLLENFDDEYCTLNVDNSLVTCIVTNVPKSVKAIVQVIAEQLRLYPTFNQ